MSTLAWDRAAVLPDVFDGRPRPEVASLGRGLPTVAELFTFARDAELRFSTLRMRIEERTATAAGERDRIIETTLRHPGDARVLWSDPALGTAANFELWISDGATVRTYVAVHRKGTQRPVRRSIAGLDDPDFPGMSTVYRPLTALPTESLPEAFIHPAGFCQNVLATGACHVAGTEDVSGREAVVLVSAHPRATEIAGDRPDHSFEIAVDRETGVILRLVETVGGGTTRHAEVTSLVPDGSLPLAAFDFSFPTGTTLVY
jgi:hypothetical protein